MRAAGDAPIPRLDPPGRCRNSMPSRRSTMAPGRHYSRGPKPPALTWRFSSSGDKRHRPVRPGGGNRSAQCQAIQQSNAAPCSPTTADSSRQFSARCPKIYAAAPSQPPTSSDSTHQQLLANTSRICCMGSRSGKTGAPAGAPTATAGLRHARPGLAPGRLTADRRHRDVPHGVLALAPCQCRSPALMCTTSPTVTSRSSCSVATIPEPEVMTRNWSQLCTCHPVVEPWLKFTTLQR